MIGKFRSQLVVFGRHFDLREERKTWDRFFLKKKYQNREPAKRENVGLVRFELTIDGSLRHASVLQRVIIKHQNLVLSYWCSPWQRPER
jgi:hypothetical protein